MTTVADGLFQYGGMPVAPLGMSIPGTANTQTGGGHVFFVDGANGADGNDGLSVQSPLATIQRAINKATTKTGCTIFVFPTDDGYDENLVVSSVDYLTIIGCVIPGYARPDVVPATGIALSVEDSSGIVCRHMRFAGVAADCVVNEGNGFRFEDCVFDGDGTSAKAGLRLVGSDTSTHYTASEGEVVNCLFRGCANGIIFDTAPIAASGVGSSDNLIRYNKFISNTLDIATAKTGAGADYSVQNLQLGPGNVFADKNKATYIDITTNEDGAAGNQSGTVVGNFFATDTMSTTKIKAVGTAFTFVGNMDTVGVFDGSGLD